MIRFNNYQQSKGVMYQLYRFLWQCWLGCWYIQVPFPFSLRNGFPLLLILLGPMQHLTCACSHLSLHLALTFLTSWFQQKMKILFKKKWLQNLWKNTTDWCIFQDMNNLLIFLYLKPFTEWMDLYQGIENILRFLGINNQSNSNKQHLAPGWAASCNYHSCLSHRIARLNVF